MEREKISVESFIEVLTNNELKNVIGGYAVTGPDSFCKVTCSNGIAYYSMNRDCLYAGVTNCSFLGTLDFNWTCSNSCTNRWPF